MTTDIEAQLREARGGETVFDEATGKRIGNLYVLAADKIAALKSLLAEAREALRPFGSLPALPLSISVSVWASDISRAAEVLRKMENG